MSFSACAAVVRVGLAFRGGSASGSGSSFWSAFSAGNLRRSVGKSNLLYLLVL